jgi:hypothetical protein
MRVIGKLRTTGDLAVMASVLVVQGRVADSDSYIAFRKGSLIEAVVAAL